MSDRMAETAQLFHVIEAMAEELRRQGLWELLTLHGLDLRELAKVAIKAAEGGTAGGP
jgi:hypothetical protein